MEEVADSLTSEELQKLRSLSGQILWVFSQTRLAACYDSLELRVEKNKATIETVRKANKVERKLKRQQRRIFSTKIGKFNTFELHVYSDASFANLLVGASSAGGYIIFLTSNQDNGLCCLLEWKSVKLQRVLGSTLEAESISLREAKGAAIYMGDLFK